MLSYYDPTSNLVDLAIVNADKENTTAIQSTTEVPMKDCVDLLFICVPPFVFGFLALLLIGIIVLNVLKGVLKIAI